MQAPSWQGESSRHAGKYPPATCSRILLSKPRQSPCRNRAAPSCPNYPSPTQHCYTKCSRNTQVCLDEKTSRSHSRPVLRSCLVNQRSERPSTAEGNKRETCHNETLTSHFIFQRLNFPPSPSVFSIKCR